MARPRPHLARSARLWGPALAAGLALAALPIRADGIPNAEALALNDLLQAVADQAADPARAGESPAALLAGVALPGLTIPAPLPLPPINLAGAAPEALVLDLRLALTMLSQTYGDDGNSTVLAAQADPLRRALVIRQGLVTLDGLAAALTRAGLAAERRPDGGLVLTLPLVLWPGAALHLAQGQTLALSRPDGAFLINFGDLTVTGGMIEGTGLQNPRARSFFPFVTTADSGTVTLTGATIRNLGFGDTLKFGGFAVLRSLLHSPARPAMIDSTSFSGLRSVTFGGEQGAILQGNRFRDMTGPALVLSRTDDARITGNLFTGGMPTNAIRIEDASRRARLEGNAILGGDRAGIVVRGESSHALLTGNIVWQRDGGGIALIEADCGRVESNLILDNDQKGVEVRASEGVAVTGNTIFSNHSAAVWVSAQDDHSQTFVAENRIAFNGSGLATANGAAILLSGNDFSRQYQQFLSGDLTPQSPAIARDLSNGLPLILTAATAETVPGAIWSPGACSEDQS
jgi:poly(beta-D-mannuronate) C5 epimerase